MITLTKDKKSPTYIITKTDNEGYSKQLNVNEEEMEGLVKIWTKAHKL